MNTYKNIFRACNGTRIAQCSLLIALAFLCLAIVCMCVFYNLNALATNNIAYAEEYEPVRSVTNEGYYGDNYLEHNYWANASASYTLNDASNYVTIFDGDYCTVQVRSSNATITGNYFNCASSTLELLYTFKYSFSVSNFIIGLGYASGSYFGSYVNYTLTGSTTWSNFSNASSSNRYIYKSSSSAMTISNGSTLLYSFGSSTFYLNYVFMYSGTVFSGYVSPDYKFIDSAGSSESSYSDISSTGIVRDNLINNNNCSAWNYNLSFNSSRLLSGDILNVFDSSNVSCYLQYSGSGSLVDNLLSCDADSHCYLVFKFKDNVLSASFYTFSVGLSHYSIIGYDSLYLESGSSNGLFFNYSVDYDSGSYISLTCDLSNSSVYPDLDGVYFAIYLGEESSVNVDWVKLELGESFSGYVPIDYSMYGYQDGYNKGYSEGYDAASLESFNRIGDLENMSFIQNYVVGDKTLFCSAVEEDSFTYDGTRYEYQYFETEGEEEVYNGLVIDYNFSYKVRIITQFFGSDARWNEVGFKILIIDSSNHNSYFFVTREDTQYITFLSTWTNVGNAFGDIYNVQIDIPLPDNTKYYNIAFVPINWNYHDINAESRSLRASSYQDTSSMLIWDNTQLYGLTTQSNYANIVEDRVHEAWSDGHYQGIQEGRSQGESTGYTIGYNAGINAAGDYTFYSLLGAVFDTPISTLRGLLNFNILGVNLYDFVIALLSLAIVLFVFRIFVRGL